MPVKKLHSTRCRAANREADTAKPTRHDTGECKSSKAKVLFLATALLAFSGCTFYFGSASWALGPSHATKAEALRDDGKCAEAIEAYLLHVKERLQAKGRPADENPYFYYLLIGDCHLQMGDPIETKRAYLVAKEKEVTPVLVNERFRRLGGWYEKQNRLAEAIEILTEFRTLDPLMYDYDIDRIHREIVRREEEAEAQTKGSEPSPQP